MKRLVLLTAVVAVLAVALSGVAVAAPADGGPFPDTIALPDGFSPEGIVVGEGSNFYVGSLVDGRVLRADLRTGEILAISAPLSPQLAVGLAYDRRTNLVYSASGFGPAGQVAVFDGETMELVANILLSPAAGFVNDVIVTRNAVYLTDSAIPVLYRVGLDGNNAPNPGNVATLPMAGFVSAPGFNANGIEVTEDGKSLIVVNSTTGVLYQVDPATGDATPIDLGGESVVSGDGLVLSGNELYVVQNGLKQVAVFKLSSDLSSAELQKTISLPDSETPTTADLFGNSLYLVDARFATPPLPTTEYEVTRVDK
jgi:sugar lactone lactonase YvrE